MLDWVTHHDALRDVHMAICHWRTSVQMKDPLRRCDDLAKAFDVLVRANPAVLGQNADVARYRLIEQVPRVLLSSPVASLLRVEPPIQDTDALRRGADPDKAHRQAIKLFGLYQRDKIPADVRPMARALADLLWVVRSNSMHGHKRALMENEIAFPQPRDQTIAGYAADVFEECLSLVLGPLEQTSSIPRPEPESPSRRFP